MTTFVTFTTEPDKSPLAHPGELRGSIRLFSDQHSTELTIRGYVKKGMHFFNLFPVKYPYPDGTFLMIPNELFNTTREWTTIPIVTQDEIISYWLRESTLFRYELENIFPELRRQDL